MTPAEMKAIAKAIAQKASAIESAIDRMRRAEEQLIRVNQFGKEGQVWRPLLQLKKPDNYGSTNGVSIEIAIPFGVIQQQAVYQVEAARRDVIKLGGQP